jgi:hypothetical protein
MRWAVLFHEAFYAEFEAMDEAFQDEFLEQLRLLSARGPQLGRPAVDALKGSGMPT